MESENEPTIQIIVYDYLKINAGEVNIDDAKIIFKSFIEEDILDKLHYVSELIDYLKSKTLSKKDFIMLFKCLFTLINNNKLRDFMNDYEYLVTMLPIEDDDDGYIMYKKLAKFIEDKIGSSDVQNLKHDFKYVISSERTLSNIYKLSQLLEILEDRDAINNNDLSPLQHILEKFNQNNPDIIMIKKLISLYLILSQLSYKCKTCNCNTQFILPEVISSASTNEEYPSDELQSVIIYLSKNLGPDDWKRLARAFKIKESKIKSIIEENHKNVEEQIIQMLMFWRNSYEEATLDRLIAALESPICRKRLLVKEIKEKKHLKFS